MSSGASRAAAKAPSVAPWPPGWGAADGDDLHPASNIAKMAKEDPLADADRLPWLAAVAAALRPGTVVACTALRRSYRDLLRDSAPAPVVLIHLSGQRATLLKRMADISWPGQGLHRSRGSTVQAAPRRRAQSLRALFGQPASRRSGVHRRQGRNTKPLQVAKSVKLSSGRPSGRYRASACHCSSEGAHGRGTSATHLAHKASSCP